MRAAVVKTVREISDRFAPYLTERFVLLALRSMGMDVFVKNASKWMPFVGALISAGLGYKLTYSFGDKLIDECEAAAKEMIHSVTQEVGQAKEWR